MALFGTQYSHLMTQESHAVLCIAYCWTIRDMQKWKRVLKYPEHRVLSYSFVF